MPVVGGRLLRASMRSHGSAMTRAIAALPLRDAAMTITGNGPTTQKIATLQFSVLENSKKAFFTSTKDVAASGSQLNQTAVA